MIAAIIDASLSTIGRAGRMSARGPTLRYAAIWPLVEPWS